MNWVPWHNTMIGHFYEHGRSSGALGENVDGWSPKGVHVLRRTPLLPLDPRSLSYVLWSWLLEFERKCVSERAGLKELKDLGKKKSASPETGPSKPFANPPTEYHVRPWTELICFMHFGQAECQSKGVHDQNGSSRLANHSLNSDDSLARLSLYWIVYGHLVFRFGNMWMMIMDEV